LSTTIAKIPTRAEIIARAQALAPKLRARSAEAEKLRRVPDASMEEIVAAQLPRICQPSRYGGFDMPWDVLCNSSMELAHGCGSQAWVASVFGEHACLLGHFPDEAQRDVWGKNPDALISSSYFPAALAEPVEGGFLLTGKWGFSSGIHHADWTALGALRKQDKGPPQHMFLMVPKSDRKIIDDWHSMGMAGTGSCSLELDKVFVPEHRTCMTSLIQAGNPPGAKVNPAPVFRLPILGYAHFALCSVCVGTAEGLVEDFAEFLRERVKPGAHMMTPVENAQTRLTEAASEVRCARLLLLTGARTFMSVLESGRNLSQDDATPLERDATYAAVLAKRAATRCFEATGGRSIALASEMQRKFRDVYGGASHVALNWDKACIDYGRRVMGMPVQSLF
jgi:3-hydroxy-9,10-secoandrosta-1,3,5(10)-triene-9,17-dione monooxygenase